MTVVYKTVLNRDEEKELMKTTLVLFKRGIIKRPSKHSVTKFALLNLITSVNQILEGEHGQKKEG